MLSAIRNQEYYCSITTSLKPHEKADSDSDQPTCYVSKQTSLRLCQLLLTDTSQSWACFTPASLHR